MEDKILGFGYQDDQDESLKSKDFSYGVFGLNQRVLMTKCDYNPNGGANGTESDCLDISFKVGEGEVNQRWFPITRVFYKGEELTDTTSSEYIAAYNEQMKHFKAVMTHYLKAFNTEETIKGAFKTPPSNFVEYFKLVSRLMSQGIANKILLDLFLQYQWNIGENATQTYLEIPKNLKDGAFLTPHMKPVGEWKEEHNWIEKDEKGFSISMEGLRYVDDAGNVHRFKRNKNFMESNKAKKQTRTPVNMSTDSSAKAATW
jgi:hypothetical protein